MTNSYQILLLLEILPGNGCRTALQTPASRNRELRLHWHLQNCLIARKKKGACRIHGGGFAGVIMAVLPNEIADEYISYMEKTMGEGNAYLMSIRPYGSICFNTVAEQ